MRRVAVIAVLGALLAGCGGGSETTARPETVDDAPAETATTGETETGQTGETGETGETTETAETEVEGDPQAGETIFAEAGCGSCHKFTPAGSSGTTGPDLDELPELAENADDELAEFTRESIIEPGAYVEEGFPNIMPAYEGSEEQVNNLVAFLIQG